MSEADKAVPKAPDYTEVDGFKNAIKISDLNRALIERNFAMVLMRQSRSAELKARFEEANQRIRRLEADFEEQVKLARLERQASETALKELQTDIEAKARNLQATVELALGEANIPKGEFSKFRPTFTKEHHLICISQGSA